MGRFEIENGRCMGLGEMRGELLIIRGILGISRSGQILILQHQRRGKQKPLLLERNLK